MAWRSEPARTRPFYPELPLHEGNRIIAIGKFDRQRGWENERLLNDFQVWRRELRSVVDLGAFRTIQRNLVSETGRGQPIKIAEMTASGFRVPRVPPLLGRTRSHTIVGVVEDFPAGVKDP